MAEQTPQEATGAVPPEEEPTTAAASDGDGHRHGRGQRAAPPGPDTDAGAGGDGGDGDGDAAVAEAERAVLEDFERLAKERDEYLDQYKRIRADFENYRKRILKQQTEHLERAAEQLVEKLLPVLDTFDAAIAHGEGFEQVHKSLTNLLRREGLHRIDPAGKPFDPAEADAVAHEDGDGGPVVAEVLRPGYKWKGRVLRPAMVRVKG
jgi:molecular chaperone GrpE